MRLPVGNVQNGLDTIVDNPGLESPRGAFGNFAGKDQFYSIRTALIQVVPDDFLKSRHGRDLKGAVKDLGEIYFKLPHREAMLIASPLVFFGERIFCLRC